MYKGSSVYDVPPKVWVVIEPLDLKVYYLPKENESTSCVLIEGENGLALVFLGSGKWSIFKDA